MAIATRITKENRPQMIAKMRGLVSHITVGDYVVEEKFKSPMIVSGDRFDDLFEVVGGHHSMTNFVVSIRPPKD